MRLRINVIVSALALLAIVWGVRFAIAQERRRSPEYLQAIYRELNAKQFDGTLPAARMEWASLMPDAMGQTFQESDDSFVIQVDKESHFSFWNNDELLDTVRHEMCHIAVWNTDPDAHGASWQACMAHVRAK